MRWTHLPRATCFRSNCSRAENGAGVCRATAGSAALQSLLATAGQDQQFADARKHSRQLWRGPQLIRVRIALAYLDISEGSSSRQVSTRAMAGSRDYCSSGDRSRGARREAEHECRYHPLSQVVEADPNNVRSEQSGLLPFQRHRQAGQALKYAQQAKELDLTACTSKTRSAGCYTQGTYGSAVKYLEGAVAKQAMPSANITRMGT